MREPDPLPVAVRAYAPSSARKRAPQPAASSSARKGECERKPRTPGPQRQPPAVLVLDVETTTDAAQSLLLACWRYYRLTWDKAGPTLACVAEGLLHADDLEERDVRAHLVLARYAERATPETDAATKDAERNLALTSRSEFIRDVYLPALAAQATVVGFNLPFDLTRIALGWGAAEADGYEGGFSLLLAEYEDDAGRRRPDTAVPRQLVRSYDSRRARIGLGGVRPGSDPDVVVRAGGSFLDLRTLAQALSGEAHSLGSACEAFGVPYRKRRVELGCISAALVDYCREDVAATTALYESLAREYERWNLQLAPTRAYSGASLAKALLRESRIEPILKRQPDFPAEVLGYAMTAYFGGRAETRVRRTPVSVTTLDFRSMHPTVAVRSGLSRFLTCERIEVVEESAGAIAKLQRRLDRASVADCLDPAFWPTLNAFVLVEPRGENLPVRARYATFGAYGIGVNPLWSEEPLWFTLADVLASTLLTGRAPRILRVLRLDPRGRRSGLQPLRIRDARAIDPAREDVFRALVEERRRLERVGGSEAGRTAAALKLVANSLSYGIWAELNRQEPSVRPTRLDVYGLDRFRADVAAVEEPGEYFFGPLAALVTGGARLMLALLELLVTDADGTWAMCDTDGMAVVSAPQGGLVPCPGGAERDEASRECVRALTWAQVDEIVERFSALNPYDRSLVPGSILSLDPENFHDSGERRELHCYAISAKRYCLFTRGAGGAATIAKASEHALGGVYLDPRDPDSEDKDWVEEAWAWILAEDALGIEAPEPSWLDRPALSRFTASHPRLLEPFAPFNEGRPYAEQVKPYGFLLVAHGAPFAHSRETPFVLVAPYERDPSRWATLPWRNVHDRESPTYTLATSSVFERGGYSLARNEVGVPTYRDVLARFRVRPESKSDDRHGRPCARHSVGLLQRRPVRAITPVAHIGKETNLLDEVAAGLLARDAEALTVYEETWTSTWDRLYLPVLKEMNVRQTAAAVGVNPTTITRIRAGQRPRPALRDALAREIGCFARARLREGGITVALDDEAAVKLYRHLSETPHHREGP